MAHARTGFKSGVVLALWLVSGAVLAGPGEDPVTLSNKVTFTVGPWTPAAKSTDISYHRGIPDDIQAKIARYTAQSHTSNTAGISTERDVVQSVKTNGTHTTCVQSVGSNTIVSPAGGRVVLNGDQIVVLRGDMINICN